ncbi:beta-1,3-galactosyltransferase 5-like isoform X2 [Harmonia axyridis]|uniref:beta-1,3-galactosyltransferase 5-like isoform X2 n=1 Tax=Harmonia axyridis TaxID=115357 RepID=UPI001E279271|nr:beta-1,3-galactosyltransferase 5-like isoform X2 [Harmonia axyridis]
MLSSFIFATIKLVAIMVLLILIAYMRTPKFLLRIMFEKPVIEHVNYSESGNNQVIGSLYPTGFQMSNPHLCPDEGLNISLLIAVFSRPSLKMSRNAIRKTWGQFSKRRDVSIVFFVGQTDNEVTKIHLDFEQEYFADIVQGRFSDTYFNLTLKTLSILEWVQTFCPKADFLLKTDEDVFVHVDNLLELLTTLDVEAKKIYGGIVKKLEPYRNEKIKYFISTEQYKLDRFPDFMGGPGYLFAARLAADLYSTALQLSYIKVEDVLFTGLV